MIIRYEQLNKAQTANTNYFVYLCTRMVSVVASCVEQQFLFNPDYHLLFN